MDELIPVISRIREAVQHAALELDFDLPQIAVVGGQSVGKSSLLEAVVGHAFLPTGTGVVTRRPLILQLLHGSAEYGEFEHLPNRRFQLHELREEICRETEQLCGTQKAVSATPIVLRVSSPKLITLTLVDLPGLARVPVGDQPEDIEKQIRQLIFEHIAKPNCLILAVAAANADLATADALALAREVDPRGERTLGVLTKMDLAEQAAQEAHMVLEGKVYPLSLGFVGVMCKENFDHRVEENFFSQHAVYKSVAQHCTVQHLTKLLNRILLERIRDVLPGIRTQAQRMCQEAESELQGYGEALERQTPGEKGALLLNLFAKFSGRFDDTVEGRLATQPLEASGQLLGRARIDFLFRDVFAKTLREHNSFAGLSDDDIRVAIRNATGPRARLFIPEAAFEQLVRRQVRKLQAPSLQCAQLVFDELQRVLLLSELPEFRRFLRLRDEVFAVVRDILKRCLEPTMAMIRDLVAIEMAYINTNHPDFVQAGALRSPPPPREEEKPKVLIESQGEGEGESAASSGIFSALFRRQSSGGRLQRPAELPTTPSPPASPVAKPRSTRDAKPEKPALKLPSFAAVHPSAQAPTDRERVEVHIVKKLMESYLALVKKNIADSVPKAIMFFLVSGGGVSADGQVSSLKDAIQSECVTRLYKEELYDSLLFEGDVESRRSSCLAKLEGLRRVIQVTDQVRDI